MNKNLGILNQWQEKNDKVLKSKKTFSKLLNEEKLMEILDGNYEYIHKENLFDLREESCSSSLFDKECLKDNLLKAFCPENLDFSLFSDLVIHERELLHEYNGLILGDILDILMFSKIGFDPLVYFEFQNIEDGPCLIYFDCRLSAQKNYIIKVIFANNPRASVDQLIVVKRYKNLSSINKLKFILENSLVDSTDGEKPMDNILVNNKQFTPEANYGGRSSYFRNIGSLDYCKTYLTKAKKIAKNHTYSSSFNLDGTIIGLTDTPIYKPNNKSVSEY